MQALCLHPAVALLGEMLLNFKQVDPAPCPWLPELVVQKIFFLGGENNFFQFTICLGNFLDIYYEKEQLFCESTAGCFSLINAGDSAKM